MASITIRNLDDRTKARLRTRAAQHQRSMEDEARHILRLALSEKETKPRNLAETISQRFLALGGVTLSVPERQPMRDPPKFEK